jgi:hypothetical protein
MSNQSPKRTHLEDTKVADYMKQHFAALGALLIATNSKDLECDFAVEGRQFHTEVSEVVGTEQ